MRARADALQRAFALADARAYRAQALLAEVEDRERAAAAVVAASAAASGAVAREATEVGGRDGEREGRGGNGRGGVVAALGRTWDPASAILGALLSALVGMVVLWLRDGGVWTP